MAYELRFIVDVRWNREAGQNIASVDCADSDDPPDKEICMNRVGFKESDSKLSDRRGE